MKSILLLGGCLALAGCVEVTKFKSAEGDTYYAMCDDKVRLQSCTAAMAATCPNGYEVTRTPMIDMGGRYEPAESKFFRCR